MSVRVRYAPSPTGSPHVGNIRTALFCHLMAKRYGGVNMLRIEDTDRSRFVPGCEEEIIESLRWMKIDYQEGPDVGGPFAPYRQSERQALGVYDEWIKKLIELGHAYLAFDTPEELKELREYQEINRLPQGYFGGMWRDATEAEVSARLEGGQPYVIRLKMPRERQLVVQDAIRGRVEFDAENSDDPVLIKADKMPTYHFAAMVDDHLMGTTHIIRGEEWISSAPKHVWLFEAFGWEPPVFVHVPVINGLDGKKLSKRHGDTRLLDFRAAGYLSEALANFVALIGWSPGGDRELMSMDEMAEAFDLRGIQPSPGVFDLEKLKWMNGHYIRHGGPLLPKIVEDYAVAPETQTYWKSQEGGAETAQKLMRLADALSGSPKREAMLELGRERVVTLADFGEALYFLTVDQPEMDPKAVEKWQKEPHVASMFAHFIAQLENMSDDPTAEDCEALIRGYASEHGLEKLGPVVHPTRVALTGKTVGPGLFELMAALGRARMIARLRPFAGK